MKNRARKNELKVYLSEDERYVLDEKWRLSKMKSRSAFIRHLILYGYVYDVDYEHLKEYSHALNAIGRNINQITAFCQKTGSLYEEDVKKLQDLMEDVWRTHGSMLSGQPYISQ